MFKRLIEKSVSEYFYLGRYEHMVDWNRNKLQAMIREEIEKMLTAELEKTNTTLVWHDGHTDFSSGETKVLGQAEGSYANPQKIEYYIVSRRNNAWYQDFSTVPLLIKRWSYLYI